MKRIITTTAAALAFSLVCATASAQPASNNKDIAIQAMVDVFGNRDSAAVDRYFAPSYKQHNLTVADGLPGLKAAAAQLAGAGGNTTIYRAVADKDFVALQSVYEGIPAAGGKPAVVFDLFRFEKGKIVEHWGTLQPLGPANASGHTMVDGPGIITDLDKTEANRKVVTAFVNTVLAGGAFDRAGEFLGARYTQHNPMIGDGLEGFKTAFEGMAKAGVKLGYKPHRILAQGNFVFVQAEGSGGALAINDLFRLEKGKIVEHWDVVAPVPPRDQWKNTNGAF